MKREVNMRKRVEINDLARSGADMRSDMSINTDPDGMWTGVPTQSPYEEPIQDVDDL